MAAESFAGWSPSAIEGLLPTARLGRYERGEMVKREDDGAPEVLLVLSGHMLASRLYPDDSRVPVFIFNPGNVASIQARLDNEKHAIYAYEAHDSTSVLHLSAQLVVERLDATPFLWKAMAKVVVKQHRSIASTLLNFQSGNTRQRLAATISRLARIYGVDDDTRNLRLRLSQDDLAAMLQVTRRSINGEMRALEAQGLVRSEYNAVTVLDLQALRSLHGDA
ncbi:cAMP-binding domain of CRP or a regulatory subunit of cAMP-dependent protein kinases [Variovorax sp. 770b2]|nr:cAMP-binding domain of CRP or a regulatory subunit of cAMP-dependent protein kinases [Variovorax sp. 770b2]